MKKAELQQLIQEVICENNSPQTEGVMDWIKDPTGSKRYDAQQAKERADQLTQYKKDDEAEAAEKSKTEKAVADKKEKDLRAAGTKLYAWVISQLAEKRRGTGAFIQGNHGPEDILRLYFQHAKHIIKDMKFPWKDDEAMWMAKYVWQKVYKSKPPVENASDLPNPIGTMGSPRKFEENTMKLRDLATKVLNEDTWGNNPAAAGGMSQGRQPNTTPQPASGNVKFYDLKKDYAVFNTTIEKQEELAKKKLDTDLSQQFNNKKITARASKGSVGQVEKDYSFTVVGVDIVYLKDKFYIVLKGSDKSDYFVNTEFKVKIDNTAPEAPTMDKKQGAKNIVQQPVIGMTAKGGNTAQGANP